MFKVIKKRGKIVEAYCVGEDNEVLNKLISEGKIVNNGNGSFEIFSQEAVNGKGEIAYKGDYIKLDSSAMPYPNSRDYFLKNHKKISENTYEQLPKELYAWDVKEKMCDEIRYLISEKGLIIDEKSYDKYYTAPLWGTLLSAKKDAVIIFYSIYYEAGKIKDISYNFVAKDEFDKTYNVLTN